MKTIFTFNKKGQSAIELLLILGGIILVAVIIIAILFNIRQSTADVTEKSIDSYSSLMRANIIQPIITSVICNTSDNNLEIYYKESPTSGVTHYYVIADDIFLETAYGVNPIKLDANYFSSKISLVAKKGDNYSYPSLPSVSCIYE